MVVVVRPCLDVSAWRVAAPPLQGEEEEEGGGGRGTETRLRCIRPRCTAPPPIPDDDDDEGESGGGGGVHSLSTLRPRNATVHARTLVCPASAATVRHVDGFV